MDFDWPLLGEFMMNQTKENQIEKQIQETLRKRGVVLKRGFLLSRAREEFPVSKNTVERTTKGNKEGRDYQRSGTAKEPIELRREPKQVNEATRGKC